MSFDVSIVHSLIEMFQLAEKRCPDQSTFDSSGTMPRFFLAFCSTTIVNNDTMSEDKLF